MESNDEQTKKIKKFDCDSKIKFLKDELLDSDKCREFSQKLCEYIKDNSDKG